MPLAKFRFFFFFLMGLITLSGCATSSSNPIEANQEGVGRITEITISAPSLAGNLLGDPTEQRVSIYLPPGYDADPDRRYPVLYLLHGFTGTQQTWMKAPDAPRAESMANNGYQWAGFLKRDVLDEKIQSGEIPPMILVAPNGRNAFKHSFYVNSSVTGNWEDYVVEDVVGHVDTHYRTLPAATSRGIAGHSGGGNGALFLAMRHSDLFGSVYASAPCCLGATFSLPKQTQDGRDELNEFWQIVYARLNNLSSVGDLPDVFTSDPKNFWTNTQLASAAAYAPNPNNPPFYGNQLYQMRGGDFVRDEDVFTRRKTLANYYLVPRHVEELKSLKGIFIDYGELEWDELSQGNAEFVHTLSEYRIPFRMEIYADGDHGNLIAQRMESHGLPFFAKTLKSKPE